MGRSSWVMQTLNATTRVLLRVDAQTRKGCMVAKAEWGVTRAAQESKRMGNAASEQKRVGEETDSVKRPGPPRVGEPGRTRTPGWVGGCSLPALFTVSKPQVHPHKTGLTRGVVRTLGVCSRSLPPLCVVASRCIPPTHEPGGGSRPRKSGPGSPQGPRGWQPHTSPVCERTWAALLPDDERDGTASTRRWVRRGRQEGLRCRQPAPHHFTLRPKGPNLVLTSQNTNQLHEAWAVSSQSS